MRPTRFSTSRRLALTLTAVFLGVAPLAGCAGEEPVVEEEDEALILSTADVAEVERGPLASGITLTGTLNPYREVTLNAQVPGTVGRLRYEEGDRVQRGATMAVIEAQGIRLPDGDEHHVLALHGFAQFAVAGGADGELGVDAALVEFPRGPRLAHLHSAHITKPNPTCPIYATSSSE